MNKLGNQWENSVCIALKKDEALLESSGLKWVNCLSSLILSLFWFSTSLFSPKIATNLVSFAGSDIEVDSVRSDDSN